MVLLKFKTPQEARKYKTFLLKSQKKFGLKCNPKVERTFSYQDGKKVPYYYVRARCKSK